MKKLRQSVHYEHLLGEAADKATRELLQQALTFERRLTDAQFGQLNLIAQEHRVFHEREHLLYEDAIDKAASALSSQLKVLEADLDRVRDGSHTYMTVDRFEREHANLMEKMEVSLKNIGEKVGAEERVTVREQARNEVLDSMATTRRWLIGLTIAFLFSAISTIALIVEHIQ